MAKSSTAIPNLADIQELTPVETGEYDLRLTFVESKTFDSGANCINMCFEFVGEDTAEPLWHKIWMPSDTDDKAKAMNKLRSLKKFLKDCNLPEEGGMDLDIFDNLEITAKVVKEYDDFMERDINTLKSIS